MEDSSEQPPPSSSPGVPRLDCIFEALAHPRRRDVLHSLDHVPKLAADDIVTFREADETVLPGTNTDQALGVLDHAGGCDDSTLELHARRNVP